ncbi:hypothetical protein C8R45DRAFT_1224334 [Mycena sanguinolenta]|nr:hypothetical protein C8R45DRAFT_1224334 [Mycena sanguinolenta]
MSCASLQQRCFKMPQRLSRATRRTRSVNHRLIACMAWLGIAYPRYDPTSQASRIHESVIHAAFYRTASFSVYGVVHVSASTHARIINRPQLQLNTISFEMRVLRSNDLRIPPTILRAHPVGISSSQEGVSATRDDLQQQPSVRWSYASSDALTPPARCRYPIRWRVAYEARSNPGHAHTLDAPRRREPKPDPHHQLHATLACLAARVSILLSPPDSCACRALQHPLRDLLRAMVVPHRRRRFVASPRAKRVYSKYHSPIRTRAGHILNTHHLRAAAAPLRPRRGYHFPARPTVSTPPKYAAGTAGFSVAHAVFIVSRPAAPIFCARASLRSAAHREHDGPLLAQHKLQLSSFASYPPRFTRGSSAPYRPLVDCAAPPPMRGTSPATSAMTLRRAGMARTTRRRCASRASTGTRLPH